MEKQIDSLLSVIVPVYKTELYLNRCVESILKQTYSNLEIILVEDGSPDRCPQMCDEWEEIDSRIRVIHKENGGLSDARNAGIALATGEFLAFVDSDDYIAGDMYEIMISALRRTAAGIVCCGTNIVKDGEVTPLYCIQQHMNFSGEDALRELISRGSISEAACDKVYRRKLFDGIEFPVDQINEDLAVMPYLLEKAGKVTHVGVPLYFYCQDAPSITRCEYSPTRRDYLHHLDEVERFLREKHETLIPYFDVLQACYCQAMLYLLLDNSKVKQKYHNDYCEFFARFRKSFKKSIKIKRIEFGERMKGYLIYYGLYYYLHELKKSIEKAMGMFR